MPGPALVRSSTSGGSTPWQALVVGLVPAQIPMRGGASVGAPAARPGPVLLLCTGAVAGGTASERCRAPLSELRPPGPARSRDLCLLRPYSWSEGGFRVGKCGDPPGAGQPAPRQGAGPGKRVSPARTQGDTRCADTYERRGDLSRAGAAATRPGRFPEGHTPAGEPKHLWESE